ncbi:MAG TPA: flagellar hook assembly protein FlgD [Pelovirga sp.]|nr:flagellar hook assembly protein FlgD [Pelovirga sp.]
MTAISSAISEQTPPLTSMGGKDVSMGKEDFLKLLVAQLQHQDPLNPADPTEFTAQLAQFGQLEQLTNANKSLEQLGRMSGEMEKMSALSLIGQDVVAEGSAFHFNGESMQLGYQLDTPADKVNLYVQNQSGSTLTTITGRETSSGQYFVDWDGYTDSGMPLVPGDYSLIVHAMDAEEKTIDSKSLIKGRVESVDLSGSAVQLDTSSGTFALGKIAQAGGN